MSVNRVPYFLTEQLDKGCYTASPAKPHKLFNATEGRSPGTEALQLALQIVNTTLSHEVYNELAPIYVLSELLLKRTNDPEVRAACEIINSSAKSIKSIIASLKTMEQSPSIPVTEYLPGTQMIDLNRDHNSPPA